MISTRLLRAATCDRNRISSRDSRACRRPHNNCSLLVCLQCDVRQPQLRACYLARQRFRRRREN
jgi:hypothetical protein